MDRDVFFDWLLPWSHAMSGARRTPSIVLARQMRMYKPGDRVRVLRGALAGEVLTVHQSSNDWVTFKEMRSREVMSKGNVEPEMGFTDEEITQAGRVAEKMKGKGN